MVASRGWRARGGVRGACWGWGRGRRAAAGWPHAGRRAWRDPLAAAALDGFAPYLACIRAGAPAGDVLQAFEAFRVLCPHRCGPAGVELANRIVEDALAARRLIRPAGASGPWYV